jgi:hypothetical protein
MTRAIAYALLLAAGVGGSVGVVIGFFGALWCVRFTARRFPRAMMQILTTLANRPAARDKPLHVVR